MRIVVFGSTGLAGYAIAKKLLNDGHEVICPLRKPNDHPEDRDSWEWEGDKYYADLLNYKSAYDCLRGAGIYVPVDAVVVAAGSVGGIEFNMQNHLTQWHINQAIGMNAIAAANNLGIQKLIYLASSCCYPSNVDCDLTESMFGYGMLEPTNHGYAKAKINCAEFCRNVHGRGKQYVTVVPTNLYGQNDNYAKERSHVVAALIRKAIEAKATNGVMQVWGSGAPIREFLHADDLASGVAHVLSLKNPDDLYNVGTGQGHCISILASIIAEVVDVRIDYDSSKPDGMRRKVMNVSKINQSGWSASIDLATGIESTIADLQSSNDVRGWKDFWKYKNFEWNLQKVIDTVTNRA